MCAFNFWALFNKVIQRNVKGEISEEGNDYVLLSFAFSLLAVLSL